MSSEEIQRQLFQPLIDRCEEIVARNASLREALEKIKSKHMLLSSGLSFETIQLCEEALSPQKEGDKWVCYRCGKDFNHSETQTINSGELRLLSCQLCMDIKYATPSQKEGDSDE